MSKDEWTMNWFICRLSSRNFFNNLLRGRYPRRPISSASPRPKLQFKQRIIFRADNNKVKRRGWLRHDTTKRTNSHRQEKTAGGFSHIGSALLQIYETH